MMVTAESRVVPFLSEQRSGELALAPGRDRADLVARSGTPGPGRAARAVDTSTSLAVRTGALDCDISRETDARQRHGLRKSATERKIATSRQLRRCGRTARFLEESNLGHGSAARGTTPAKAGSKLNVWQASAKLRSRK
jgi:hypothetical protein